MIYSSLLRIGVICLPGYAAAVDLIKADNPIEGQYIVTTNLTNNDEGIGASSFEDNILKIISGGAPDGIGANSHYELKYIHQVIDGFTAALDDVGLQNVLSNPNVVSVEQDGIATIDQTQVTWGLDRIDDENLPLDNSYEPTFGKNGEGVTAYIIDTGILASHTEFEGRATQEFNSAGSPNEDCNGHGTHVAGTVGSKTYGVANKVKLVGVKVLSCSGSGSWSGVIAGIDWVKTNAKKPATANLSLGGGKSSSINAAIKNLHDSGVTTVVAAGNSNANACSYSPASEPTAITVGSTTNTDGRSSFSNYGTCVDIFAPGSSITAPWIGGNTKLRTISGTSMASPHVCGGAALYLAQYPNITPEEVVEKMIEDSIADTITNVGTGSPNKFLHVGSSQAPTVSPAPTRKVTSAPTKPPTQGSDGYRIYAPSKWIVRGNVWDVRNVKFFPNTDCTGKLIRDGKAMSSGHYPNNDWIPENAFGDNNSKGWGGRGRSGLFWLGMEFTGGRSVKCVSFVDMNAASGTRGVTVQHKNNGVWEDIVTLENISPGVRQNIPLGRTCNNGRLVLEIDVTTGNSGKENTVSVKRMGQDGWAKRKSMYYEGFEDNSMKKLTHCLHPEKCYKIAIKDRGGDGMTDGDGSYIIKVDGDIIKDSEFATGRKEETLFNC